MAPQGKNGTSGVNKNPAPPTGGTTNPAPPSGGNTNPAPPTGGGSTASGADHPEGFTDNFGLTVHGPELRGQAKTAQIVAAETFVRANMSDEVSKLLKQVPKRVISVRPVRGNDFTPANIVSAPVHL